MIDIAVPDQDAVWVGHETLHDTVARILEGSGLPLADARLAADVLVRADLRGVESHGVSNMLRRYLDWLASGRANARARRRIVRDRGAVAALDGDRALGVVVAPEAMRLAVDKARAHGIGMVTVHRSHHLGMAAYHALLAVEHDMVGVCLTATAAWSTVPTFGAEPRIGTNPIACAAPADQERPFVFDAATSALAWNRVVSAQRLGIPLPPGTVAGADGTPNTEPAPATGTRNLLPLGSSSETGSHKGYGLACVVEILSRVLGATAFMPDFGRGTANHLLMAIDIGAVGEPQAFKAGMDDLVRTLRATPPAAGHEQVLVAGDPEWAAEDVRRRRGIPLHPDVVGWLARTCGELGVPAPAAWR